MEERTFNDNEKAIKFDPAVPYGSDVKVYDSRTDETLEINPYIHWMVRNLSIEDDIYYSWEPYVRLFNILDNLSYGIYDETEEGCLEHIMELREGFLSYLNSWTTTPFTETGFKDMADWKWAMQRKRPSVLELLVSLSRHVEKTLMTNTEYGDRTAKWFWTMLINLGLNEQTNSSLDEEFIKATIDRWLKHKYEPNGDGSPFPLKNPPTNLRGCTIWQMLMWYINENFEGRW